MIGLNYVNEVHSAQNPVIIYISLSRNPVYLYE